MTIKIGIAAFALSVFLVAPAMAQTAPGSAGKDVGPEPQSAPAEGRSDSLSSKLSRTNGVITPNGDVDPGMHVPAPDPHPNSTPVIPPSATGGNTAK